MRIGELARAVGLDVETVRYYERAGLLPAPARHANNYRRYGEDALRRLRFIRNCRALDMSLDEVRTLLAFIDAPGTDCRPVDALVAAHLDHVRDRIRTLRQLERQLVALQRACGDAEPHAACGVVLELGRADPPGRRRPARGVHRS